MGFLIGRMNLPSGYLIPMAISLDPGSALAACVRFATAFATANPGVPIEVRGEKFIFHETEDTQTVFRTWTLNLER